MNDVVRDLTVLLREEATRRGISIQTDLWSGLPLVRGDRVQLQQVVLNLVMNGLDAMDDVASGLRTVRISTCAPSAAEILVRVEDGGVGLTPETAERIFEPFYTTKPQGIGMGLAISRSIVEAHEGRLWAAPSAPQGAVLQFTLPLLTAPDGDDA